ncbi:MAG: hypothetical protein LBR39_03185 [Coriobacteriales bacterium]|jgi:hypothetical protein|nr:hypothetical protein [Coriobacteriales bacterium]
MAEEQKDTKQDVADESAEEQKKATAYEKKAEDTAGRDWTKRKTFLKPGQV